MTYHAWIEMHGHMRSYILDDNKSEVIEAPAALDLFLKHNDRQYDGRRQLYRQFVDLSKPMNAAELSAWLEFAIVDRQGHIYTEDEYNRILKRRETRRRFLEKFPGLELVVTTDETDYEDLERKWGHQTLDASDIFDWLSGSRWISLEDIDELQGIDGVKNLLLDCNDYVVYVESVETYEKRKREEKRKKLESRAAQIAEKHGVKVNSPEFIDACYAEINAHRDYRYGMEEDGLCIGWGVTADQWLEERNWISSQVDQVYEVIDFIRVYLPILFALWEEDRKVQEQ